MCAQMCLVRPIGYVCGPVRHFDVPRCALHTQRSVQAMAAAKCSYQTSLQIDQHVRPNLRRRVRVIMSAQHMAYRGESTNLCSVHWHCEVRCGGGMQDCVARRRMHRALPDGRLQPLSAMPGSHPLIAHILSRLRAQIAANEG